MAHPPRAVRVQTPVTPRLTPSAVHIILRARPAVQSAYDANSTFVIRPDALAGVAVAVAVVVGAAVPIVVVGWRGLETFC